MYPQLFNQASRLAPMLQRLLSRGGSFATPFWKASQIDVPDIDTKLVSPMGPAAPQVYKDQNGNAVPPPAYGPGEAPPQPQPPQPTTLPTQPMPPVQGLDLPGGIPGVPMPRPRPPAAAQAMAPAAAPQEQPDTSFFMRNALMQQDPVAGGFIDPMGAASVRGPDLISKMMQYLHNKA